jgi:RNA polymerase sigma factor (sigma-70 family)
MSMITSPPAAGVPPELSRLLGAPDKAEADEAWGGFVARYSRVLLHTCRAGVRDRDAAMDVYAHVLDGLREDRCRRLRAYTPRPGIRFTTWLVVVTRRLMLDYYRHRYGRARSDDAVRRDEHVVRRRLEDLIAAELDPEQLATSASHSTDLHVRREELTDALRRALSELSPTERLLLTLRFEDERPVRDIAVAMRLPTVFHVYRRLGAALAALRRALGRQGVEDAEP